MSPITGISTRGDRTIIRNNYITDASGAGVRVGGGIGEDDGQQYGVDNEVRVRMRGI